MRNKPIFYTILVMPGRTGAPQLAVGSLEKKQPLQLFSALR